jgi:hypothetical protein
MDRLKGSEYDMVVIDFHSMFTMQMMRAVKLADRGNITIADLMNMEGVSP